MLPTDGGGVSPNTPRYPCILKVVLSICAYEVLNGKLVSGLNATIGYVNLDAASADVDAFVAGISSAVITQIEKLSSI